MLVKYKVTLTATAQSIKDALGLTADLDLPLAELYVQADKANDADAYVGPAGTTSSAYGIRVDPGDTAPPIPIVTNGVALVKPSQIYCLGTAGQILHFHGVVV